MEQDKTLTKDPSDLLAGIERFSREVASVTEELLARAQALPGQSSEAERLMGHAYRKGQHRRVMSIGLQHVDAAFAPLEDAAVRLEKVSRDVLGIKRSPAEPPLAFIARVVDIASKPEGVAAALSAHLGTQSNQGAQR